MRLTKPETHSANNPRNTFVPQVCPSTYDVTIYFASTANEVSDAFGPYGVHSVSFPIRYQLEEEATL